jgi:hypothetical protein
MTPALARAVMICCVICSAAYLVFLTATWAGIQSDRQVREAHMNSLLDQMKPKPSPEPNVSPNADRPGSTHDGD